MRFGVFVPAVITVLCASTSAFSDVEHVVQRGHTIESIANRYHVTAKAIVDANHLKDVKRLRPGDVLTIPTKDKPKDAKDKPKDAKAKADGKKDDKSKKGEPTTYAMKAKTPGVVHVKRIATTDDLSIRVKDGRGKVPPTALKSFEKMMRSPSGLAHPIDARLISLLGVMSNHFGSRKIEVVSGFRPYTPTQYTQHSNHNHGKAIDFRVVGVPNESVRDFCRTLKNVGCGYYPNSVFVHMDVREQSAFWIDYSKPGEPPRYNAPNSGADEGTSDVHDEPHIATGSAPGSVDEALGATPETPQEAAPISESDAGSPKK